MLKINNLTVEVDKKKIIKDLSLMVKPGELHILMGPNGAGKTSLTMAIMGKLGYKVTGGKIILDGEDISKLATDKRAKKGLFISFQKPVEISGVTVRNLLRLVVKDRLEKKLLQAVSELKISEDLLTRPLNENFSGGEAKKMEFFQAKLISPKFLILDEVDSGLDIDALLTVTKNIQQMLKSKLAPGIILITHNPRILKFLQPDYIHILIHGTIAKTGGVAMVEQIEKKGYLWLTKN